MKTLTHSFKDGLKANEFALKLQKKFPTIPESEIGNIKNYDKIMLWLTKERQRVKRIVKKRTEL